ncbi:MAG: cystathionine gamma-lyase [Geodermatophilaceae bacterium]|nr:cystathionine gamma-lyase [Geodermatophilaceae bacterium]
MTSESHDGEVDAGTALGDGTRAVHAGKPDPVPGQPLALGPVFAGPYHLGTDGDPTKQFYYGRNDNPTVHAFEAALEELEGGPSVVFPSGMGAVAALLSTVLAAGDRLVIPGDGYFGTRVYAEQELAGIDVVAVATTELAGFAAGGGLDGVALVLAETPNNTRLDVVDLSVLVPAARAAGCLVAVDNTVATPLGQRPLALGADFSYASDTKALSGHSDVLLGHVASADPARAARLRTWRTRGGSIPGPFEVWLAHRSLGTLHLRLDRQAANAHALAGALLGHRQVRDLRWPGLPEDPAHDVVTRQHLRPVGMLSFVLPDADAVRQVLRSCRIAVAATSFGGLHTTIDRRAQWGGDDVPEGYVRVSCGCEDAVDLVQDLLRALDGLGVAA